MLVVGLIGITGLLKIKRNTLNLAGIGVFVNLHSHDILHAKAVSSQSLDQQLSAYQEK